VPAVERVRSTAEILEIAVVLGKMAVLATDQVVVVEMMMDLVMTVETTAAVIAEVAAVVVDMVVMIVVEMTNATIHLTAETVRGLVIAGIEEIHKITVKEGQGPDMETAPGHLNNRVTETMIRRLFGRWMEATQP